MEQQYISDQDFIAVIRTILLFLDSQNFKETCSALVKECENLGYPEIRVCPKAALTCRLSSDKAIGDGSEQRFYKGYKIESNIDKDVKVQTAICLYYTDITKKQKNVSSDLSEESQNSSSTQDLPTRDDEELQTQIVYKNDDLIIVSSPYTFGGQITEEMNCDNKSPANDLRTKGTESVAETAAFQIIPQNGDSPARGTKRTLLRAKKSKGSNKKYRPPSEKRNKMQGTTSTNVTDTDDAQEYKRENQNKRLSNEKNDDCLCCNVDCHDLKIKLRDLQTEHRKLMGVAAELTLALQSNILGQSENLNHMLNNCKKIYPDLFLNSPEKDVKSRNSLKSSNGSLSSKSNKSCNTESPALKENTFLGETYNMCECDESSENGDPKDKSDVPDEKNVEEESFQIIERPNENAQETDNNATSESSFELVKNKVESLKDNHNENANSFSARSGEPEKEKKQDDSEYARKNSYVEKNEIASELVSEMCDIAFKQSEEYSQSDTKSKTSNTQSEDETKETTSDEEKTVDSKETLKEDAQTQDDPTTPFTDPKDYFELNFRKVKNDLIKSPYEKRLRLLQALRWRITKSDENTRDIVMGSYIRHDLLGLHKSPFCNLYGSFLDELYCPYDVQTPHPIQEGIARLVNAFASLTVGRDYLCQDDKLLSSLILPLTLDMHRSQTKIDDITRDMLLATLQKLSLRNRQRHLMISSGLVEYLITFLTINHDILSDYCMEYCTALFMNLCLHKEAREACRARAPEVIILLLKLLNEKHSNCIPYVNGAMYSLLSDPIINREALDMDLTKMIEQLLKRSNGEIKKQLEIILKIHLEGDEDEDCVCDSNMDVQEEVDLLEPELDMRDEITTGVTGEALLNEYKLSFTAKNNQQPNQFTRLCQPITPRSQNEMESLTNCPKASRLFMVKSPQQKRSGDTNSESVNEEARIINFGSTNLSLGVLLTKKDDGCPKIDEEVEENEEYQQTNEKTQENIEEKLKTPQSPSSIASTEKSFSEDTKQFYHKPSAKRGIFDTNPPASYTRTIEYSPPAAPMSSKSPLRYYYRSKETSSTKNPSNANFFHVPKTCYRDNLKQNTLQRDKYKCQCYDKVKEFVEKTVVSDDQTSQECNNNEKDSPHSNSVTPKQKTQKSENATVLNDPALYGKKRDCENICDLTCYKAVFKSRPKILRTP